MNTTQAIDIILGKFNNLCGDAEKVALEVALANTRKGSAAHNLILDLLTNDFSYMFDGEHSYYTRSMFSDGEWKNAGITAAAVIAFAKAISKTPKVSKTLLRLAFLTVLLAETHQNEQSHRCITTARERLNDHLWSGRTQAELTKWVGKEKQLAEALAVHGYDSAICDYV